MITGQEKTDEGKVSTDRGVSIAYFSKDVGEMRGRSAVGKGKKETVPFSKPLTQSPI
jgi:hypothetical protein